MTLVPFPATTKIPKSSQDEIELFIYCHTQTNPGATQPPFQHAPETLIFIVVKQVKEESSNSHLSWSKTAEGYNFT